MIPLSTPGSANTEVVKLGEFHTSSRVPCGPGFFGIGLYAWSSAPVPLVPLLSWIIQSSAEPEAVPFDVTMGLPEPKLNQFPEFVVAPVSYTHLRAHETGRNLVCR